MSYSKTRISAITMSSDLGTNPNGVPEIDIAVCDNFTFDVSLNITAIPPYTHFVELADIDISANVFKLLFFNIEYTGESSFNTLTNSYVDYVFSLLPPPPTSADVQYIVPVNVNGTTIIPTSPNYNYYTPNAGKPSLSHYISILSPSLKVQYTGVTFSLSNTVLDNIVDDLTIAAPGFADLFNTMDFIDFNRDVTNLKTLNDIIPASDTPIGTNHIGANMVNSLNWNNILELVRAQYDNEYRRDISNNMWLDSDMFAVLKITLIFKTHINLVSANSFTSTSQVKLRYKINFKDLECFQGAYNKIQ
jgi:hypothetical protein